MDNPAMKPANTGTWPLGYINKAQPNDVENQWKTHGFQTDQDLYMVDVFLFFVNLLECKFARNNEKRNRK